MLMDFDPGDDFASVSDGLASVTVTRPGSSVSYHVTGALGRVVRTREAGRSDGRYTASDVAWHLPASEVSLPPRPGDLIIDDEGQRWTVLDVQKTTLGSRWRCVCRNLAVVHGLDQYIDIERATYTKGEGGAERATWQIWRTGLRARIQPAEIRVKDGEDRRATAAEFTVFLLEDVALDHTHRIKGPDGAIYQVLGRRKADRIDALMEVDVLQVS